MPCSDPCISRPAVITDRTAMIEVVMTAPAGSQPRYQARHIKTLEHIGEAQEFVSFAYLYALDQGAKPKNKV